MSGLEKVSLSLEDYMNTMKEHGLETDTLKKMIFFDDLVRNPDRHLNNWGFSVDNDTREILGFSPIWDTGEALIAKTLPDDFPLMLTSEEEFSSFGIMYKGLRPLFYGETEIQHCRNLKQMITSGTLFKKFKEQHIPDTEDERLALVCEIVLARIEMILSDLGVKGE